MCDVSAREEHTPAQAGFWQIAEWDEETTEHDAQVWIVGGHVDADQGRAQHADLSLVAALGDWTGRRYDFHWCIDRVPGFTVNINRTLDNIHSKGWCEAQMEARTNVPTAWELASRSVEKRNLS